jgi:carbonic anhydrase
MPPSKLSRREFTTLTVAAGFCIRRPHSLFASSQREKITRPAAVGADEALRELLAGNKRFVTGTPTGPRRKPEEFRGLAAAQYPIAAILSCADSRVAPEILFDVGVGDIFVVRVAGNVVSAAGPAIKGSIEYAVAELHVPLIVVLGHTRCGAVKAAVTHIDAKDSVPGAINGLIELIKPAVERSRSLAGDPLENAILENVRTGVERLKELEPILAPGVRERGLKILGAIYELETGNVARIE